MLEKNVIDEIEDVFITELGVGSTFVLEQNLRELGMTRETFKRRDVDDFISHLLKEYDKVLGNHANLIKIEIEKRVVD